MAGNKALDLMNGKCIKLNGTLYRTIAQPSLLSLLRSTKHNLIIIVVYVYDFKCVFKLYRNI